MRRFLRVAGGVVGLAAMASLAASPAEAVKRAEKQEPAAAITTLEAALRQQPGDAAIHAALSRHWSALSDVARRRGQKKEAGEAARNAVREAEAAVAANPNLAAAQLALAIALGRQTDFVGNREKMALSRKIRTAAERAAALAPGDPLAWEILGRWEYGFATLNPVLRMAARMVYGKLPAASLAEAGRFLEKAVALDPKRIGPHHHLALVYEAEGKEAQARAEWDAVLRLRPTDAEDREGQTAARAALK